MMLCWFMWKTEFSISNQSQLRKFRKKDECANCLLNQVYKPIPGITQSTTPISFPLAPPAPPDRALHLSCTALDLAFVLRSSPGSYSSMKSSGWAGGPSLHYHSSAAQPGCDPTPARWF